jgi:putative transposase
VEIADRCHVVALGITTEGVKLPLGLWEGSTENATLARSLLADLVDRGLDPEQAIHFVIDGGKALRRAVKDVFGEHALVHRCHRHKERNVTDLLPERERPAILAKIRGAWALTDPALAEQRLERLASEVERAWPDAAASLREGMSETLTLMRLGIGGQLANSLCSTSPCESLVRHEASCERREGTNNSHPCRLENRPRADAAARRSWGQSRRGIARWRQEQSRQRSGRVVLPDTRVCASKTER